MQSQQEKEATNQPGHYRSHRSMRELLAGWLLVLWGAFSCFGASWTEKDTFTQPFDLDYVRGVATVLYALCCLASGFTTLLRLSLPTRILLTGAAFWVLIIAGVNIPIWLGIRTDLKQAVFEWTLGYITGGAVLLFLGRWLGRLEDIDLRN